MSNPQKVLAEFDAAVARSATVKKLALGRPSDGIAACVAKIIAAARQDALHIIQAADVALLQLPLPR
jgi:hypothetical protein